MPNSGQLDKNLQELAELEKILWDAFKESEKKYRPPFFNVKKSIPVAFTLMRRGYLKKWHCSPFFFAGAIVSAAFTVTISDWFSILYLFLLALSILTKTKYVDAYTSEKLKTSQYTKHGFGLENLSLTVAGVMYLKKSGEGKLNAGKIAAITKIVKASHEYGDVSFGLAEHLKKTLYAAPLAFIVWVQNNPHIGNDIGTFISDFQKSKLAIQVVFSIFAIYFLLVGGILCYELIFGQTITKRQKKKYLLILNVISESFAIKVK
ncbi:hypothetical protein [Undibacterium curvum]|uniref:hypothetical protein n=1 Tax=Undibacterium curvum TaxID=2762294 RepID=UPI003D124F7A